MAAGQTPASENLPTPAQQIAPIPTGSDGFGSEFHDPEMFHEPGVVYDSGMMHDGEIIHDSGMMHEPGMMHDSGMMHEPGMWVDGQPTFDEDIMYDADPMGCVHGTCPGDCGGACGCSCDGCLGGRRRRQVRPIAGSVLGSGDLSFEIGTQGFTGPTNLGASSSFGFHQSVNLGVGAFRRYGVGFQLGVRTLQSNLSGAQFSDATRKQTFLTTGLFRRSVRCGWQYGFAIDLLSDDWYDETTLRQVRGELGWRISPKTDWGYAFNFGGDEDTTLRPNILTPRPPNTTVDAWEPLDLHALYLRTHLRGVCNSALRCFVGFSGESDGLIGCDTTLPIGRYWAIRSGATYLVPAESSSDGGFENEAWNVAIALTWNYRGPGRLNRYTPLFNVADNGSFIVDRVSAR